MTQQEYERLNRIYDRFPDLLTPEQRTLFLQERARIVRNEYLNTTTPTPLGLVNQMVSGFISGFTALGNYADEPTNTWEAIANSVGHLAGFVGMVAPGVSAGKGVSKAARAVGDAIAAKGTSRAYSKAMGFYGASEWLERNLRSVPMIGADWFMKRWPARTAVEYLKGRPVMQQAITSGGHLGAAMFVSELHNGVDEAMKAAGIGFITGGYLDAGLGNIPILSGTTTAHKVIKSAAGAISNSVAGSVMYGNPLNVPIEMLVYDALLGGYFGWKATDAKTFQATRYIANYTSGRREGSLRAIASDPDLDKLDPEIRNIVLEKAEEFTKSKPTPQAIREVFGKYAPELLEPPEVELGQKVFVEGRDLRETYRVRALNDDGTVTLSNNEKIDRAMVSPWPQVVERLDPQLEYQDILGFQHDFEGVRQSAENPFSHFLRNISVNEKGEIVPPKMSVGEFYDHEANLLRAVDDIITRKRRDPEFDDVGAFRDRIEKFVSRKKLRPQNRPIPDERWADVFNWYTNKLYSEGQEYRYYDTDSGRLGINNVIADRDASVDPSETVRKYYEVPPAMGLLMRGDRPYKYGSIITTIRKRRDGKIIGEDFIRAKLTNKDHGNMIKDLHKDGFSFFGGAGDKTKYWYVEYAPQEKINATLKELYDEGYGPQIEAMTALSHQQLDIDPTIIRQNIGNNATIWKMLNGGAPFKEIFGEGRYITSVLDFNKRLQIPTQQYKPVHPGLVDPQYRKMRYVIVNDANKKYDGIFYLDPDPMNDLHRASGISNKKDVGADKWFHYEISPDGFQMSKPGGHAVGPEMQAEMKRMGVHGINFTTAGKATGKRQVYDMEVQDGKIVFKQNGKVVTDPVTYELTPDNIYMSRDIYDDSASKINKPRTFPIQMNVGINDIPAATALARWKTQFIRGTEEGNALLEKYMETGDPELIRGTDMFPFMDKVRVNELITKDLEFQKEFFRWMLDEQGFGDPRKADDPEMLMEERLAAEKFMDFEGPAMDVMRLVSAGLGRGDGIMMQKFVRDQAYYMVRKYLHRMSERPKVPFSGSARLSKLDPIAEYRYGNRITDETFMLGRNWENWKITGIDMNGESKRMTLKQQWDMYEPLLRKAEEGLTLSTAERKSMKRMAENLEITIARLPIDNPSGIIPMRFNGFVEAQGGNMYVSERNMRRLGGADYDIDSAFFYHGLPKAYRDYLKTQGANQDAAWKQFGGDPSEMYFTDRPETGAQESLHSPIAMFDPYNLILVNKGTSVGRGENLPRSVAFVKRLSSLMGYLESRDVPGPTITYSKNITNYYGDRVAAQYDRANDIVLLDEELIAQKFADKAWTKPRVSGVDPLPEGQFKTVDEWRNFVIEHERAHSRMQKRADESTFEYENRVNQEALRFIKEEPRKAGTRRVEGLEEYEFSLPATKEEQVRRNAAFAGVVNASADAAAGGVLGDRIPVDWISQRKIMLRAAFPELAVGKWVVWDRTSNRWGPDPTGRTNIVMPLPFDTPVQEAQAEFIAGRSLVQERGGKFVAEYRGKNWQTDFGWKRWENTWRDDDVWRVGDYTLTTDDVKRYLTPIKPIDSLQYMARYIDLNSKWYRNNQGKPWTFEEIRDATKRFVSLKARHEPLWHVANLVKDFQWEDSFLTRIRPTEQMRRYFKFWDIAMRSKEMEPLIQLLPERIPIPYESISKRINAFGRKWKYIETGRGRMELSKDDKKFNEFFTDLRRSYKPFKDDPDNERFIKAHKLNGLFDPKLEKSTRTAARRAFIQNEINKTNDFVSERLSTLAAFKSMVDLTHEMDVDPVVLSEAMTKRYDIVGGDGSKVPISLVEIVRGSRAQYRRDRGRRPGEQGEPSPMDNMIQSVRNARHVAERISVEYGLDGQKMQEMVDLMLLSPVRDVRSPVGQREHAVTSEERIGTRFAHTPAMNRFAQAFSEAYDITLRGEQKDAIRQFFGLAQRNAIADHKRVFTRIVWPKHIPVPKDPAVEELKEQMMSWFQNPDNPFAKSPETFEAFWKNALKMLRIAQPSDMTIHDMRGLVNYMRELQYGPSFWNHFVAGSNLKLGLLRSIGFPYTLAREDLFHDLRIIHERMIDPTGKVSKYAIPSIHVDPNTGKLVDVFTDTLHFTSTLGQLNVQMNNGRMQQEMGHTKWREGLEMMLPLLNARNRETNEVGDVHKLIEYAGLKREEDGFYSDRRNWEDDPNARQARARHHQRMRNWEDQNRELLHKEGRETTYSYPKGDETVVLTGKQMIKEIQDFFGKWLDEGQYLTPEWMKQHLSISQDGIVDYQKTLDRIGELFATQTQQLELPSEGARLISYLTAIEDMADTQPLALPRKDVAISRQINNWEVPFLKPYQEEAHKLRWIGKSPNEVRKEALRLIEQKGWDGAPDAATAYVRYTQREYSPRDYRRKLFDDPESAVRDHSQLQIDNEYHAGRIDDRTYKLYYWQNAQPFYESGYIPGYIPHRFFEPKTLLEWYQQEVDALRAKEGELGTQTVAAGIDDLTRAYQGMRGKDTHLVDSYGLESVADEWLSGSKRFVKIENVSQFKPSSMQQRSAWVPGYEISLRALEDYVLERNDAAYKTLQTVLAYRTMKDHAARLEPMEKAGKLPAGSTQAMQHYYRMYVRASMEMPSIFTADELNDPLLNIKKTPYWFLSDHFALVEGTMANKLLRKMLRANSVSDAERYGYNLRTKEEEKAFIKDKVARLTQISPDGRRTGKFTAQDRHNIRVATRLMKRFSQMEARYEMATLLAALKSSVANLGGGNLNTIILHGFKNWRDAWNPKVWNRLNPEFKNMSDVHRWVEELGVIQDIVLQDAQIRQEFTTPQRRQFLEDVIAKLKKDPDMTDQTLAEIAKRHGIDKTFLETAGAFMRKTERVNRRNAFLTGYLAARRAYEELELPLNTPFLIDAGRKTIQMSQFLYDNANRPLFASTNLGHIYSRFKLWSWSSAIFQREIVNEAAKHGFNPGSAEAERLQRMITANLFLMGLASLMPYTMFDASLPGPLGTMQNLTDWAFGDEQQRERAFYGQGNIIFKGWLAPVNELLPPASRLPAALMDGFNWIFNPEKDLLSHYLVWTTIPFGRMTRDTLRAIQNPAMLVDYMSGIPLHRFQRLVQQEREAEKKNTP